MNSDYYTKYIPAHLKDNTLTTSLKHPKPQLSLRIVSILPPEIATAIVNSATGKSRFRLSVMRSNIYGQRGRTLDSQALKHS